MRRNELTLGAKSGRDLRQIGLQPADEMAEHGAVGPVGVSEEVVAAPASSTEMWRCMALPGWVSIGLAMKVAYMPWFMATWRTMRLNTITWSLSATGSPCRKLISSWAVPLSWIMVSTASPAMSECS